MARVSVKGRTQRRYFFRCPECLAYKVFKAFSARFDPSKVQPCSKCGGATRECTRKEVAEVKLGLPPKKARAKDWYSDVYLKSELWLSIRAKVFARDGRLCKACGSIADVVHHTSYDPDVMAGQSNDKLVSLCFNCHKRIEFDDRGVKVSLSRANNKLRQMVCGF